jgi:hypothetical protein
MATIDTFLPEPRMTEINSIELPVPSDAAWAAARSFDLGRVPLASFLFWLRTLPERLGDDAATPRPQIRLDEIGRAGNGFHTLVDEPGRLTVGAIGKFWRTHMEFRDVPAEQFASFDEAGWGKIVWELRAEPQGDGARLIFELRLTATDDEAYRAFRRYYRLIAPFSRFFRRHALRLMREDLDRTEPRDASRPLAGDLLIPHAKAQATDEIVIDAPPHAVWPWLVQMGCRRAGWYSYDDLDNGGVRSATVIVPELQQIAVGDVLPATPESDDGFTVLVLEPERTLVLGALIDTERETSLFFDDAKPASYFQSTWAFVLEPLSHERTRLIVRARVDYAPDALPQRASARVLGLVHHFMEGAQLRHIKERAEGRAEHVQSSWHDIGSGVAGAALMLLDFATPFLRGARSHWGVTPEDAARPHPGDEHIPEPVWQWTHAVKVRALPERVWPWVAQLGQDKAGFYSYQLLENVAGCEIQNADRIHAEWQATKVGDPFLIHPSAPPLTITRCEQSRALVAAAGIDGATGTLARDALDRPGSVAVSWAFLLEPTPDGGTRLLSRYRCACSADLKTRLQFGPAIVEPVGFAMDRRMLLGIKARAEA